MLIWFELVTHVCRSILTFWFWTICFCQLYGDFADAFSLAECKLAIVHCAGHYDPTLIETLWRDIIDKGNLKLFPVKYYYCQ